MLNELKDLSAKICSFKDIVQNESQTRSALVEPFLRFLGYDTTSPFEVIPEYTCDVGTKKGEKVDYALLKDGEIVILVETKDCKVKLSEKSVSQLFRYYSVSSAGIALLTNGLDYWFFTDTIKQNVMDSTPFFVFNILSFSDKDYEILKLFMSNVVNAETVRDHAISSVFKDAFVSYFVQQAKAPSNDFISFIMKNLGLANVNSTDATTLVSRGLSSLLGSLVPAVTSDFAPVRTLSSESSPVTEESDQVEKLTGIVTLDSLNATNCAWTKPQKLLIRDSIFDVKSWSDVLIAFFKYLLVTGVELTTLDSSLGSAEDPVEGVIPPLNWVKSSDSGMRSSKELPYLGFFVDTHGNSWTSIKRVGLLCELSSMPPSDVLIELS